jgi:hypothetical protein
MVLLKMGDKPTLIAEFPLNMLVTWYKCVVKTYSTKLVLIHNSLTEQLSLVDDKFSLFVTLAKLG